MELLTGTFFCERTTAQSLPRIPIEVIFAAVIALKAYSGNYQALVRVLTRSVQDQLLACKRRCDLETTNRLDIISLGLRRW